MSRIDIVLAFIILIGAYGGYKDGFIVSLFSLFAVVLGVLGGFKLMGWAMVLLSRNYNVDEKVLPYLAFGLVFIIILICVSLVGKIIKASINKSILGAFDQGIGALLGLIKMTFMLSIMLWIADSLKFEFPKHWTADSLLLPVTTDFAQKIANWIGSFLPVFDEII